jgi:hypothetical protein
MHKNILHGLQKGVATKDWMVETPLLPLIPKWVKIISKNNSEKKFKK